WSAFSPFAERRTAAHQPVPDGCDSYRGGWVSTLSRDMVGSLRLRRLLTGAPVVSYPASRSPTRRGLLPAPAAGSPAPAAQARPEPGGENAKPGNARQAGRMFSACGPFLS